MLGIIWNVGAMATYAVRDFAIGEPLPWVSAIAYTALGFLPAVVVQGRYDMVCPIRSADELTRAWPEAEYVIVRDAGHSAMEPGIREQLVLATERAKRW